MRIGAHSRQGITRAWRAGLVTMAMLGAAASASAQVLTVRIDYYGAGIGEAPVGDGFEEHGHKV